MGIDARMLVRTLSPVTDEQLNEWSYRMGDIFGAGKFFTMPPGDSDWMPDGRRGLQKVDAYEQDGDTIEPEEGETLINVSLYGRYYGPEYERGCDISTYLHLAEWLETTIPGASVHYGGDSSGVCAEPFDRAAREQLKRHWFEHGHLPYHQYFTGNTKDGPDMLSGDRPFGEWPECPLCEKPMNRHGFGKDYASFECYGCGHKAVWRGGWLTGDALRQEARL